MSSTVNVPYNVRPNRDYQKPLIIPDGPAITTTTFKWANNSCWADAAFVALFKNPGGWLENYIKNTKTVTSVTSHVLNCTEQDANRLYNQILQDIETIQNVSRGDRQQCKTREFWTKCIEMPVKKGAFGDAFRFVTSLLKFFNVYDNVYINEDIALLIEDPSFEFISIAIRPKYNLRSAPNMLIFSHAADTKTFPDGNVVISQNVEINGQHFGLSSVIIGRLGHFASVVKDPNTGHWWFFDHKSPMYYNNDKGVRQEVPDDFKPYRDLGLDISWQTRRKVFSTMILDDSQKITTIQDYVYIPLIYIYTLQSAPISQSEKAAPMDTSDLSVEETPFAAEIAKIREFTKTTKSDSEIINDILDAKGDKDVVIMKYLQGGGMYFRKYLKYKQKYLRLKTFKKN